MAPATIASSEKIATISTTRGLCPSLHLVTQLSSLPPVDRSSPTEDASLKDCMDKANCTTI